MLKASGRMTTLVLVLICGSICSEAINRDHLKVPVSQTICNN